MGSNNLLGAASISADELWPIASAPYSESSTGLDLTGMGQTLSLWEVDGGVRNTHGEFGMRIDQRDAAGLDPTGHATSVAGTIASAGFGAPSTISEFSRGISFESDVFAHDTFNFETERAEAAAGSQVPPFAPAVQLSNHSWGTLAGWPFEEVDQLEVKTGPGQTMTVFNVWTWTEALRPARELYLWPLYSRFG